MKNQKLLLAFALLLFTAACAAPSTDDAISGPTVELPVPVSGTVLFQDDFSNPISGWDHVSSAEGAMDYDSGVYRFLVNTPHFNFWSTPGKSYADARIEVDVAKIGGPDANRAGIVCRVNGEQFYFFVIGSDGYFAVGRTNGLESILLGQDQMAASPYINTGVAVNHLRADCAGSTLAFYINGFPVAQVNDSTLASGEVGLLAGTFNEGGADIIFDQFIVMQP